MSQYDDRIENVCASSLEFEPNFRLFVVQLPTEENIIHNQLSELSVEKLINMKIQLEFPHLK